MSDPIPYERALQEIMRRLDKGEITEEQCELEIWALYDARKKVKTVTFEIPQA